MEAAALTATETDLIIKVVFSRAKLSDEVIVPPILLTLPASRLERLWAAR